MIKGIVFWVLSNACGRGGGGDRVVEMGEMFWEGLLYVTGLGFVDKEKVVF